MAKKNSNAPKKAMIFNSVLMINTENVVSLANSLPKCRMSEDSFNSFMKKNFYFGGKFHGYDFNEGSHYSTVVRQLGLYHILDNDFIPRFYSCINEQEAESYLKYWLKLYVAPNPTSQVSFRKSMVVPKYFLKELILFIEKNPLIKNIYEIADKLYNQEFSRNDKGNLPNIMNKYSDCIEVDKNNNVSLKPNYKQVIMDINELINNPNRYFEHFGIEKKVFVNNRLPLQQIFYGAPGTGKSHIIKEQTKGEDVIRTTFHPDTDYSTFVGTYKPTTEFAPVLAIIGDKAVETGREEKRISYEFVSQAFLQAYVAAWKKVAEAKGGTLKKQFLVIEEINRGNCAQIFGDLFQLLDRNDYGYSDYPIKADADMQKQLKWLFEGVEIENAESINALYDGRDIVKKVLSGEELLLPNNLYIWATMNTSDQSLFPIDSAFKRRWDWEYMPIGYKNENWTIEIGVKKYKWVDFQREINDKIYSIDNSEDKQLGDYFVNADRTNNVISSETLLNKILFYLWNDVCKDDPDQIFRWKDDKDNNQEKSIKFSDFFCEEKERKLQGFMAFLGINANEDAEGKEEMNDGTTAGNDDVVNS